MGRSLAALLTFALATAAFGQSGFEIEVRGRLAPEMARLVEPIEFDGRIDDPAWQAIPPVPLVRHWPSVDTLFSERTELRLAYDDEYLYVAARCFDSAPISETSYKRDDWADQDDQFAVVIDSYNDRESALVFVLYSTGARIDAAVSNDARGGDDINSDWNAFWDGAVSRDEHGWYGEMRIPWSTLRFQTSGTGEAMMGIITYRYIARLYEMHVYPAIPPDWGFWSFVKPSKSERRSFTGLRSSKPLYVTPYVIGGLGQESRLNDDETAYLRRDEPTMDVGFDLKYGITSNLTLDLTFNTDFAQVEADNQQVNLTRFSLFFPEKRQFFLERTSTFDFSFGGFDRVFYSRRIGVEDGEQVPLIGGGRLVGRVGAWDVGALTMQSAQHGGFPSENFGVVRLKRRILNANSYVGGIVTSRVAVDGSYNAVYGADGVVNIARDDYLRVNWAQSFDSEISSASSILESARLRLLWLRARETGLNFEAGVARSGSEYRPGVGFQLRHDFTQLVGNAGYGWRPASSSAIKSHLISAENELFFRNEDGLLETAVSGASYNLQMSGGWEFAAGMNSYFEHLLERFRLSDDAVVEPGRYRYLDATASTTTPAGRRVRGTFSVEAGGFFDGERIGFRAEPGWSISPKLEVTGTYGYDRVRFPERNQAFDAHLVRARADLMLNTKLAVSSFVQYNSVSHVVIANARLRINPREGNDFYLVYNEAFNTDRYSAHPALPYSSARALIAKYTYTFLW